MEFSLTNHKNGAIIQFTSFHRLLKYIINVGEIDGWILRIHHL